MGARANAYPLGTPETSGACVGPWKEFAATMNVFPKMWGSCGSRRIVADSEISLCESPRGNRSSFTPFRTTLFWDSGYMPDTALWGVGGHSSCMVRRPFASEA